MKHLLKIVCCVVCFVYVSGCAEQVEIEERGFVVGVAFDLAKEKDSNPVMKGTYQMVLPRKLTPEGAQAGGENYINVSAKADGVFAQLRIIAKKVSRILFFPHIQVLMFSEDLLRKPYVLENTLDVFFRDHEMRRNILIFVTKDKAEKVLGQNAEPENLPSKYIDMIAEHAKKNAQMIEAIRIGELQEKINARRSFVLPILSLTKQSINMEGAALFRGKDGKMVGKLSGDKTLGLNYIIGEEIGGFFTIRKDNKLVTYEVQKIRRKIDVVVEEPKKPKFIVDITLDGTLAELHFSGHGKVMEGEALKKYIANEMEKKIKSTIKIVQKKYKVDVLELGREYTRKDYKKWKKVEKDWDQGANYFSQCDIDVHVHPNIEHSGSSLSERVR
ncbi:spore gernimation protein GerLC [Bacillus manliponensis]|uniref:Spore gernimation protein GerLC n=1 Tax=Bacillus manliponensis TaxID=574376 RepID=A0A073K7B4_9BACI|nr:Ger(x)C family spore germination protein [Bacillus manliponensis]KEK18158.1 spore gernimation protein GerLC [Bacillus manliponensis]